MNTKTPDPYVAAAAKVKEAMQMLAILKPYLARPGQLTMAERRILVDTMQEAYSTLAAAMGPIWEAQRREYETAAERREANGAPVRKAVP
jgi:hypothetical protein